MAEHKLVPPAEQWHEVSILISKRQDDLLQQPYLPPAPAGRDGVGGLVRPTRGQRLVAVSRSLTKKGARWSTGLEMAFHTELQTSSPRRNR
jgi:hypothetical protein